jgi:hypothetical protein
MIPTVTLRPMRSWVNNHCMDGTDTQDDTPLYTAFLLYRTSTKISLSASEREKYLAFFRLWGEPGGVGVGGRRNYTITPWNHLRESQHLIVRCLRPRKELIVKTAIIQALYSNPRTVNSRPTVEETQGWHYPSRGSAHRRPR